MSHTVAKGGTGRLIALIAVVAAVVVPASHVAADESSQQLRHRCSARHPRRRLLIPLLLLPMIAAGSPGSAPSPARAAGAPTEEEILKALQKKRLTRCPQLRNECGGAQDASAEAALHVEVTFALGSTVLDAKARSVLAGLREALAQRQPDDALLVTGHADASGGDIYNQDLSERRAAAVKRFLMRNFNLRAAMVKAIGHGSSRPKNPADPRAAENRRVEISSAHRRAP